MAQTPYDKQRPRRTPPHVSLADLRAAMGLTQDAVCQKVAARTNKTFTKGALSAIEQGHRGPSAETVEALESALGLKPGALKLDYEPTHDRRRLQVVDGESA